MMTGAERKTLKSELRAALRQQSLGIPQPTQTEVLVLGMDWLSPRLRRRPPAYGMGDRYAAHGARIS